MRNIIFHPIVVLFVYFFVLVTTILSHSFLGLMVVSIIMYINYAMLTLIVAVSKKMHKASLLAFSAMWKRLTSEQRKELEEDLKRSFLSNEKAPKNIQSIITP